LSGAEAFIRRCEEVYQRHRADLERRHAGMLVALSEERVAAVGDSIDAALEEAVQRHPNKVFYVRKIGESPTCAILY